MPAGREFDGHHIMQLDGKKASFREVLFDSFFLGARASFLPEIISWMCAMQVFTSIVRICASCPRKTHNAHLSRGFLTCTA